MKQQQAAAGASATAAQRVDSPLAKYTANGDLVCILCKAPVKSSVAWNAHCATPQHKQNLELLLQKKKQQKAAAASAPAPDQEEGAPTAKRAKLAESESQATHHNEASMPDISSAAPAPPMDEPEAPQVSNEEILRQLRYDSLFRASRSSKTLRDPLCSSFRYNSNIFNSIYPLMPMELLKERMG